MKVAAIGLVLASAVTTARAAPIFPDLELGLAVGSVPLDGIDGSAMAAGPSGTTTAQLVGRSRFSGIGNRLRFGKLFAHWDVALEAGGLWSFAAPRGVASVDGNASIGERASMIGAAAVLGAHARGADYEVGGGLAAGIEWVTLYAVLPLDYSCNQRSVGCALAGATLRPTLEPRARAIWWPAKHDIALSVTAGTSVLERGAWSASVMIGFVDRPADR